MGSRRLAQTLIGGNLVQAAEIESALQRQVVLGGSLDTNLLEAELISEADLLGALALATGLPVASRADIDTVGPHVPRLFPLVFAETYHLVPVRLVDNSLTALVADVPDPQLHERLSQRLQLQVIPIVTSEARLHYAMHRLYGTELLPRYMSLLTKLDGGPPQSLVPVAEQPGSTHVLSWGVSSARIVPSRGTAGGDVRSLVARLDAAQDRDSIVEILLGFALTIFEFAGLFLIQGEHVHGWRGTTPEATQRMAQIALPLALPSVFQTIYATQGHYLGPLPVNGVNTKFLADLGRAAPRAACLAPIAVGERMVAILYADNGARGIPTKRVAALLLLLQRSGLCLESLIHRRKGAAAKLLRDTPGPEAGAPLASPTLGHHDETNFGDITAPPATPIDIPVPIALADAGLPAPASFVPLVERIEPGVAETGGFGDVEADGFAGLAIDVEMAFGDEPAAPGENDAYVAFADLNESPQRSLDDWEDVLVDTLADKAPEDDAAPANAASTGVTWAEVIAEAASATRILPQARTLDVLGTMLDERDILFDGLESDDRDARRSAVASLLKLGGSIDATLSERFPGRLGFDPLAPASRPPPFEHCSGIAELVAARGAAAAPVILPHLESQDPIQRFFAVYFLLSVHYPAGCDALARRLYDTEPRIRHLTIEALRRYSDAPAYRRIVQNLRDGLRVPGRDTQVTTMQILGQLREPSAVPALIPLVGATEPAVARTAASALAVICAQAFGNDLTRWQEWWQANYNTSRTTWLISGLSHENVVLRRVAHNELVYVTGQTVAFDPDAPLAERNQAVQAWQHWLQSAGAA